MTQIVFIRHGESSWNAANRFTGWVDVELAPNGLREAAEAGQLLKNEGFDFDEAHTSILKRAIKTLWIALEEMDRMWIPVYRHWRLNERHYGALQGLDKKETAQKYGDDQVFIWRRSFSTPPPPLTEELFLAQTQERRFERIPKSELPRGESLKDCLERVVPYWNDVLAPAVKRGQRLLVVAHGNSIRALVKHLEGISEDEIAELNIPTGIPLVYDLDDQLKPMAKRYLGDPMAAQAKAHEVAQQAGRK